MATVAEKRIPTASEQTGPDGLPAIDARNSVVTAGGDRIRLPGAHVWSWKPTHKVRGVVTEVGTDGNASQRLTPALPFVVDSAAEAAGYFAARYGRAAIMPLDPDQPTHFGMVLPDNVAKVDAAKIAAAKQEADEKTAAALDEFSKSTPAVGVAPPPPAKPALIEVTSVTGESGMVCPADIQLVIVEECTPS